MASQSRLSQMQSNLDPVVPLKLSESWAGRRLVEALSQLPPSNLDNSLDMRFQQKQMLEREKKKLDLSATLNTDTAAKAVAAVTNDAKEIGNGKVRQMFDERRRGAGIDRSNPLKPISKPTNTPTEPTPDETLANKTRVMQRRNVTVSSIKRVNAPEKNNNDKNALSKSLSKLSLQETNSTPVGAGDRNNNNTGSVKRTVPSNNIKLKPVVVKKTQKTPQLSAAAMSPRIQTDSPMSSARGSTAAATTPTSPTQGKPSLKLAPKPSAGKITLSVKPPPRVVTPEPGMATCPTCSRNFLEDRLAKHQQICQKMQSKQRKIFDATKQRVRGTEVEPYVKRQLKTGGGGGATKAAASAAKDKGKDKKSNWRQKHKDFLDAVRNARKVQAYLAKGGKISDLPPPPPSENPDYVQCPHCNRRFNQAAAERHIPKCVTMQHNKPKPGQKKR